MIFLPVRSLCMINSTQAQIARSSSQSCPTCMPPSNSSAPKDSFPAVSQRPLLLNLTPDALPGPRPTRHEAGMAAPPLQPALVGPAWPLRAPPPLRTPQPRPGEAEPCRSPDLPSRPHPSPRHGPPWGLPPRPAPGRWRCTAPNRTTFRRPRIFSWPPGSPLTVADRKPITRGPIPSPGGTGAMPRERQCQLKFQIRKLPNEPGTGSDIRPRSFRLFRAPAY